MASSPCKDAVFSTTAAKEVDAARVCGINRLCEVLKYGVSDLVFNTTPESLACPNVRSVEVYWGTTWKVLFLNGLHIVRKEERNALEDGYSSKDKMVVCGIVRIA